MSRGRWLAFAITVGVVVLVMVAAGSPPFGGGPGRVTTDRYAAPLGATAALTARLQMGAGTLVVRLVDSANAYEAAITHSAAVRVDLGYQDGTLEVTERSRPIAGRTENEWQVSLTRAVPVTLNASTGAGRAAFDLTGLRGSASVTAGAGEVEVVFGSGEAAVERLAFTAGAGRFTAAGLGHARARVIEARAGVGELRLDFSGAATGTTEATVRGGVGRLVLDIPADLGVRLRIRTGLTARPSLEGFTQVADGEYVNAAWSGAGPKLDLQVNLGVGGFEIRRR